MPPKRPLSPLEPFERHLATDGVLITAATWRKSHEYHRQRQNLYYQALHRAGIVWGLGVCPIRAPETVAVQYRDHRWLQIQPGLAIDGLGNPIVVPQALNFRLASEAPLQGSVLVYLVIRYVDPEKLQRQTTDEFVQESFRIDETTTPMPDLEIELCRILLQPGPVQVARSPDVFFPGPNTLDLRDRPQARPAAPALVQVAVLTSANSPESTASDFAGLLQATPALYAALEGTVESVPLSPTPAAADLAAYDLLYLSSSQFLHLAPLELERLEKGLAAGAVLLIEASLRGTPLAKLGGIQLQLQQAIAQLQQEEERVVGQELEQELQAVTTTLAQETGEILQALQRAASALNLPTPSPDRLGGHHPLRTQPFLFSQLPNLGDQPLQLFCWGAIVVAIGELTAAWGLAPHQSLARETIRAGHELGINLLHFAARHHQLTQLQLPTAEPTVVNRRPR